VRLAYLCNLYPAVSHSFVRREIEAVERTGHQVYRFSLRPARADLKDEADLREVPLTEAVLGGGILRLFTAALLLLLSRPGRTAAAFLAAWRMSGPGLQAKVRHLAYWLEAAWLLRRLNQLKVEHLHAHFGTNPAAVAAIARAWGGPPFSFTAHGPDEFDAPLALALPAKIETASFVAAISSYGRSQLMRWSSPGQWDKIGIVRCGLDPMFLDAPVEPIRDDSREFVCVARLSAQKGLPLLIAACDQLHTAGENFSVTIIGEGEMRQQLEECIRRRKLEGVISLAGVCTSTEIREHLRRARAFVLPSFAEGLPVVIMEALALSRPVIATAIAGIPELVDTECGWLIPAGSQDALVNAMKRALEASFQELSAKGAVGRERAHGMHNAAENAAALVEAIASRRGNSLTYIR
jgi:glycosyltransferase involved in cell wall biosynthesis